MTTLRSRGRLATQQATLVSSLLGRTAAPDKIDIVRFRAAAMALARKRARSVARAWPGVTRDLGRRFGGLFAAYAAEAQLPEVGGPLADGRRFVHWLAARGELSEASQLQALAVDLHYASHSKGLVARCWPTFKLTWLHQSRRLILGIRLPAFGSRIVSLRLGRS